jgi:hypothetical protein
MHFPEPTRAPVPPPLDVFCQPFLDHVSTLPKLGALTLAQLDLLCWTGEQGFVTWQEARTRAAGLSRKPAWSVKTLVRRGLFTRRRRKGHGTVYLCLSATARTLLSCLEARERRHHRELLRHLSSGERAILVQSLRLLLEVT